MYVEDVIDLALSQGDNVSESDEAYLERRRRALSYLREIFDDVWWARDWPRKKAEATLSVLAGAQSVAVPRDFDSMGSYGRVFVVEGGRILLPALEYKPESEIISARGGGATVATPGIFSIFDQEEVAAGSGVYRDLVQLPVCSSAVTLQINYQRRPPKLLDAGDPDAGPSRSVSSITQAAGVATVTTSVDHELETDDWVTIAGAVESEYNGTVQIVRTGATTFTYTVDSGASSPATGTITAALAVSVGNAALNYVPEQFHRSALLNGLKAKLRESKGDARWRYLESEYQKALGAMKRERQRFQGQNRRLPGFFGERR